MSNAIGAKGTLLKIGDGGVPENFSPIAEVVNIGGPSLSLDAIDVTNQSSTNGWKESIGGLLDGGEVTFDINYIPTDTTHDATSGLLSAMQNRTVKNFQLVFPDSGNTTWSFAALVTGFEPSADVSDKLAASVTLKITGEPTLA